MKKKYYILAGITAFFIINVLMYWLSGSYSSFLKNMKGKIFGGSTKVITEETAVNIEKRINDSIDKLNQTIDTLSTKTTTTTNPLTQDNKSGSTDSGQINSTNTTNSGGIATITISGSGSNTENKADIELPKTLTSRLKPNINPRKMANGGVFDIRIFDGIKYNTYYDKKNGIKIFLFETSYKDIFENFKLVSNIYEIKEVNNFFGQSFYLNLIGSKSDGKTRFITYIDNKVVGIEAAKEGYDKLKKLLNK